MEYAKKFQKRMRKMGAKEAGRIMLWINANLYGCDNPRVVGRPMEGEWKGFWRYRIGEYRIIVDIRDGELVVFCVEVGHRREVYR